MSASKEFESSVAQLYLADKAAERMGYDLSAIDTLRSLMRDVVSATAEEFFSLDESDYDFQLERSETDQRNIFIESLIDILEECADQFIRKFALNRRNGGSIREPFRYMAEHGLYMRDPIVEDASLFLVDDPIGFNYEQIAMIGGPSEEIFYQTRMSILKMLDVTNANLQLFTDIGSVPPYYRRFDEPIFGELLPDDFEDFWSQLNPFLKKDYEYLLAFLSGSDDLSPTPEKLAEGYEMLKYFLTLI